MTPAPVRDLAPDLPPRPSGADPPGVPNAGTGMGPRARSCAPFPLVATTAGPAASKGVGAVNGGGRADGAPGTIRTSDRQIRSLVLYPAELRARERSYIADAARIASARPHAHKGA